MVESTFSLIGIKSSLFNWIIVLLFVRPYNLNGLSWIDHPIGVVSYDHDRSQTAGSKASDCLQRKFPILRDSPHFNMKLSLEMIKDLF
jgi:hypothetical protein